MTHVTILNILIYIDFLIFPIMFLFIVTFFFFIYLHNGSWFI